MKKYYDNDLLDEIETYIIEEKYTIAKEKIDQYLMIYPNDSMIKYELLRYYNSIHDFQRAYQYGLDNVNAKFHSTLIYSKFFSEFARTLIAMKKYGEAKSYLSNAIDYTNGNFYTLINQLAYTYSMSNNYEAAVMLLNNYKDRPNYSEHIKSALCKVHFYHKKYKECIESSKDIDDAYLNSSQLQKKYYQIGVSYFNLGDLDIALKSFKNALNVKGDRYFKSTLYIAKIYAINEKYDVAAKLCEDLIKLKYDTTEVYCLMNNVYNALNNGARISSVLCSKNVLSISSECNDENLNFENDSNVTKKKTLSRVDKFNQKYAKFLK